MNLHQQKKYLSLSLIFASLVFTNTSDAQIMEAPENLISSSTPIMIEESISQNDSSSTINAVPRVVQRQPLNITREPGVALTPARQERIINLAANISNRMDAASARLFNISSRLEQRIIKMEEGGFDTNLAREKIEVANEILTATKIKLNDIDTLVNEATFSAQPQSDWRSVRERYQEVVSLIIQAHLALRESIIALKNPVLKLQEINPATGTLPVGEELIFN